MNRWFGFAMIWLVFLAIMCGVNWGFYHEDEVRIALGTGVEGAIEASGGQNDFSYVEYTGPSNGSLGDPTIICGSAQQFIDMVPPFETIHVTFEVERLREGDVFRKSYWSFTDGRKDLAVWREAYRNGKYWVRHYDKNSVVFHYDNRSRSGSMNTILLAVGIPSFLVAAGISFYVLRRFRSKNGR